MPLPKIGVQAVVENLPGYQSSLKAAETATNNAANTVKGATDSWNGLSSATDHLGRITDYVFGTLIANGIQKAVGAITDFVGGSIEAGRQEILLQNQLQAVLKSTNGVAGVTAKVVNDLADSLSNTTKFSDDTVVSAENLLLTFTKIGSTTFPRATRAVLDMSQALGQDTKASAIQLGKALQDPLKGITALQRVGVVFSATQKQQIANFMKLGEVAKAQGVILQEVETEFGGSAIAAATPWDILQNKLEKVQETLGTALVPVFDGIATAINPLIDTIMPKLVDLLQNGIAPGLKIATTVVADFITNIANGVDPLHAFGTALYSAGVPQETIDSLMNFANTLHDLGPAGTIAAVAVGLFVASIAQSAIASIVGGIGAAVAGAASDFLAFAVAAALPIIPIAALVVAIGGLFLALSNFDQIQKNFAHGGVFGEFGDKVRQAFQDALTPVVKLGLALDDVLQKLGKIAGTVTGDTAAKPGEQFGPQANGTATSGGIQDMFNPAAGGSAARSVAGQPIVQPQVQPPAQAQVDAAIKPVSDAVAKAPIPMFDFTKPVVSGAQAAQQATQSQVVPAFKISVGNVIDAGKGVATAQSPAIGKGMTDGISSGIKANGQSVTDALIGVVNQAVSGAKSTLQMHSPSRVFMNIGELMMEGWKQGIDQNMKNPVEAVTKAASAAIKGVGIATAAPRNVGPMSTVDDHSQRTTNYYLGVQPYSQGWSNNPLQALKG